MHEPDYSKERNPRNQCQSFVQDSEGRRVRCIEIGTPRVDHGLKAGTHCNSCYDRMVREARQQSY